jgi:septum formation protein
MNPPIRARKAAQVPRERRVPDVILASASPRRRRLLKRIVPVFKVLATDVDEDKFRSDDPGRYALRAAKAKARAGARVHPGDLIIAADTLVSLGRRIFGKPGTRDQARSMLAALSGRRHRVVTAVVLYRARPRRMLTGSETSRVTFKRLGAGDIEAYLDSVEYTDKAGAYAIQEFGDRLVARLEGDYDNVVGLPVGLTRRLLEKWTGRPSPRRSARRRSNG